MSPEVEKLIADKPKWNPVPTVRDNRLHKLIEYILRQSEPDPRTGKAKREWTYLELVPAIEKSNIYEIEALCDILNSEEIVFKQSGGKMQLLDHMLLNARKAYYGRKYLEKRDKWIIPLNVASFANALAAISVAVFGYLGYRDAEISKDLKSEIQAKDEELKSAKIMIDSIQNLLEIEKRRNQKSDITKH